MKYQSILKKLCAITLTMALIQPVWSSIDTYHFDNPRQEAQYRALIEEFRCPKCQNQNLAGSDAPIAQDLKQKTYDLVKEGRTDSEIRQYMYERYGDFISYKPPVRPSTWILWFFPPILLMVLLFAWFVKVRHKNKQQISTNTNDEIQPLSTTEQQRLQQLLADNAQKPNKEQV